MLKHLVIRRAVHELLSCPDSVTYIGLKSLLNASGHQMHTIIYHIIMSNLVKHIMIHQWMRPLSSGGRVVSLTGVTSIHCNASHGLFVLLHKAVINTDH